MTSGKRAKAQRRQAVVQTTTPRDPEARRLAPPTEHPLGPHAGAFVVWEDNMKRSMLKIIEENKRALEQCTGASDCPSSVHVPGCLIHPL